MNPQRNLVGERFTRLTVMRQSETARIRWRRYWVCRCDCGNEISVATDTLLSGNTRSCGCLRREIVSQSRTHGHAHRGGISPTYRSWYGMKDRCLNPNHSSYTRYGGRSIQVCERWLVFEHFLADMGGRPPGTSLDRIDPNRGYEAANCRWADAKTQGRNRRSVKLSAGIASEIRLLIGRGEAGKALAARFNVSRSLVQAIKLERVWR